MEIRLINSNEYIEANNLYNNFYGRNRTLVEFLWEFVDGPEGPSIFAIAHEDGKIVGTHAVIPLTMVDSKGNKFITGKSEEVLVLPEYRGGFTFLKLDDFLFKECAKRGIYYIWGMADLEVHHKLMKFENPFQGWQGVFVFNPIKAYQFLSKLNAQNTNKDKFKIAIFCLIAFIKGLLRFINTSSELKPYQMVDFTFITQYTKSSEIFYTIFPSFKYIKWRCYNNPYSNKYQEYVHMEANKIYAHAIVNYRSQGYAYIEQIYFLESYPYKSRKKFIKNLINTLRKQNVSFIRYIGYNTNPINKELIAIFEELGGIFAKRGMKFWWKTLKDAPFKLNLQNILMSRLYTQGNN